MKDVFGNNFSVGDQVIAAIDKRACLSIVAKKTPKKILAMYCVNTLPIYKDKVNGKQVGEGILSREYKYVDADEVAFVSPPPGHFYHGFKVDDIVVEYTDGPGVGLSSPMYHRPNSKFQVPWIVESVTLDELILREADIGAYISSDDLGNPYWANPGGYHVVEDSIDPQTADRISVTMPVPSGVSDEFCFRTPDGGVIWAPPCGRINGNDELEILVDAPQVRIAPFRGLSLDLGGVEGGAGSLWG